MEIEEAKNLEIVSWLSELLKDKKRTTSIDKLRITGVKAMAANLLIVFKYPPISEDKQINNKNGNVSLDNSIVNESFAPVTLDLHIGGAYKTTHSIKERDFLNLDHTGSHGAITLHNVKTTHGTSAQLNERVYAFHRH